MSYFYMKSLKDDGSFNVIQLDPSEHTVEGLLQDLYEAKGYAPASEEEYAEQVAKANEAVPVE